MAVFDARLADETFDAGDPGIVAFAANESLSNTVYTWRTTGGDRIVADGQGFTTAFAGRVTGIRFDLGADGDFDGMVNGVNIPLASLVASPDSFWATLLTGSDLIYAPGSVGATLFGDFRTLTSTITVIGGQDTIIGGTGAAQILYGDALTVGEDLSSGGTRTGTLTGGRDVITVDHATGMSTIVGDAGTVYSDSLLRGNADVLTGSDSASDTIYGDADIVFDSSCVGANDTIDGRGGDDILVGDVNQTQRFPGATSGTFAYGGHDVIRGGEGADTIYGDFARVARADVGAISVAEGRNDRLFGDAGDDTIYGDGPDFDDAYLRFGRDYIEGGAGNDTIYGDVRIPGTLPTDVDYAAPDEIHGGADADFIDGGFGADRLFGDSGDDVLIGGPGNDQLTGGADADSFVFLPGSRDDRILDFEDDVDEVRISADFGFANAAEVLAAARTSGGNLVVKLDAGDYITFVGYGGNAAALADDIVII